MQHGAPANPNSELPGLRRDGASSSHEIPPGTPGPASVGGGEKPPKEKKKGTPLTKAASGKMSACSTKLTEMRVLNTELMGSEKLILGNDL